MMKWFWGHCLDDPDEAANPCAVPLRARDYADLAPALVIPPNTYPLRDAASDTPSGCARPAYRPCCRAGTA